MVRIVTQPGTVVDARPPAAASTYITASMKLMDVLLAALGPFKPERAIAHSGGTGGAMTLAWHDKAGRANQFEIFGSSYGGTASGDGLSGVTVHLSNIRGAPIEIIESEFPCLLRRFELIPDSGGAGKFRGGLSFRREYEVLAPATLVYRCDRAKFAPRGLDGGHDGAKSRLTLHPGTPQAEIMPSSIRLELAAGDTFEIRAAAGGGFGSPAQREVAAIRDDVENGYVSAEGLVRDYGRRLAELRLLISREVAAAVDVDDLASHVAGGIADEELRHGGDVLGLADTTEQRALGDLAQGLVIVVGRHCRFGRTRTDGVDANAQRSQGACKRSRQADDGGLGRHIGRTAATMTADAADIDRARTGQHDRAAADHSLGRGLRNKERAGNVDGEDAVEMLRRQIAPSQRRVRRSHVDQAGERAEFFPGLCDHVPAVGGIRNVCAHRDEARCVIVQPFRRHRLQVGTAHFMARCEQALHAGEADAARCACNDDGFGAFACHRMPRQTPGQVAVTPPSTTMVVAVM